MIGYETTGPTVNVTIADSEASNNGTFGVYAFLAAGDAATSVTMRNSVVSNNTSYGVVSGPNTTLLMSRSVVTGNGFGALVQGGGIIQSTGDNDVDGNVSNNWVVPFRRPSTKGGIARRFAGGERCRRKRTFWMEIERKFCARGNGAGPPRAGRRRVSVRAACSRLILLIALATAFAPGARADTFSRGSRAYAAQNYVLAAPIFQSLADQGDPRAQLISASCICAARACRRVSTSRSGGFASPRKQDSPPRSIFSA